MTKKVRVLIVDDSLLMRKMLCGLLSEDSEVEVVGQAPDPFAAREMIKAFNPDVVTLDIEMPRMDGVTFLRKIMELRPTPVVMISSLTQQGADVTLRALEAGAVDFVAKPSSITEFESLGPELVAKVKAAGRLRFRPRRVTTTSPPRKRMDRKCEKVIAVGASTGGVEALKTLLLNLPPDVPPVLIAQHMPERFTAAFARRLDSECPMRVHEAEDHQPVETGNVYIAPGGRHLELGRMANGQLVCRLNDDALVSGHRPSVDVLFNSVAAVAGGKAVGAILTGMGRDGANGLLQMRKAGCITLGQDEESSLIYGMPRVAFEIGAVERQHSLNDLADEIISACTENSAAA